MDKHLHIISLDVPYPVDFGGVFDIYYKLVALHEAGIKIHLHCFLHERPRQSHLENYCESVHYYERQTGHKGLSHKLPYIVSSRNSDMLVSNLLKDDHPILAEGAHCTFFVHDHRFTGRRIILRLHNVESTYYQQLAKAASSPFRKLYYHTESKLLKNYEHQLVSKVSMILPVSGKDGEHYKQVFKATNLEELPVFLGYKEITAEEGIGFYCLYHGNLSVAENEKAALWLVNEVFNDLKVPLVIAGKNPSESFIHQVNNKSNCCVVANPEENEMADMIRKAQIHVLPSLNATGIKLKLINVLFNGRHAVVNDATVVGTGFEPACHIAGNASGFKSIITQLYHKPFTDDEIRLRSRLLKHHFDNSKNAEKLIGWIWNEN